METPFSGSGLENLHFETVTIAAGASASADIFSQGHALVGIFMPAAWTAANIGYEVSFDNKTWVTAYDNAQNLEQSKVQASSFISIPLGDAIFAPFLRLKSVDATNAAVNQVAAATLILVLRRYLGGS